MRVARLKGADIHWREDGDPDGRPVVFANSLGTDLRLWDDLVARLPDGLRLIRYDKRGHGLSSCPPAPYKMGSLVSDAEELIEHAGAGGCVFVGLSIGGMIAQGLAAKRPDLVRAAVFSNTGVKIGTRDSWDERIATIREHGLAAILEATKDRWFGRDFRDTDAVLAWGEMFVRQPVEGYAGCCAAIAGTDLLSPTSGLDLPVLCISGTEDGSTPPDMLQEIADLVKGARHHVIRGSGHLSAADSPDEYAEVLTAFLQEVGHV